MATAEERLMEWLRDAHAMEEQGEQMLDALLSRIEHYPQLKAKVAEHLEETKNQTRLVRQCIERRGGSPSLIKDLTGKVMAVAQGISGVFVGDEIVKGAMASYTFEHMEVAAYKILIAGAATCGDAETQRICTDILAEEERMAAWLGEHLPSVASQYLAREEAPGVEAKH